MRISELPQDIKELALENQRKGFIRCYEKNTDILADAFWWGDTKEGFEFWDEWDEKEPKTPKDQNVIEVIESFKNRSEVGFKKYGTNTERTDIDLLGWLNHLQEELQDAVIYIQRIKKEL